MDTSELLLTITACVQTNLLSVEAAKVKDYKDFKPSSQNHNLFQSLASLVDEEKPELGVVSPEHVTDLHHVLRKDVSRGHQLISSIKLFVNEEST